MLFISDHFNISQKYTDLRESPLELLVSGKPVSDTDFRLQTLPVSENVSHRMTSPSLFIYFYKARCRVL